MFAGSVKPRYAATSGIEPNSMPLAGQASLARLGRGYSLLWGVSPVLPDAPSCLESCCPSRVAHPRSREGGREGRGSEIPWSQGSSLPLGESPRSLGSLHRWGRCLPPSFEKSRLGFENFLRENRTFVLLG